MEWCEAHAREHVAEAMRARARREAEFSRAWETPPPLRARRPRS